VTGPEHHEKMLVALYGEALETALPDMAAAMIMAVVSTHMTC